MILTKKDIEKVYDELERRIRLDIKGGTIPDDARYIKCEYRSRLQGVYGTIMAIVSNENWRDIVWWCEEIEKERFGEWLW